MKLENYEKIKTAKEMKNDSFASHLFIYMRTV
jgi:hypothetical protein